MLGLLRKDFYTSKKELLLTGFIALIFVAFNVTIAQKEMLGPSIGVLISVGSLMPTYSIHYDKTNGWDKFICASPISRTQVVLSKYLAGLISIAAINLVIVLDNMAVGSPMPVWGYAALLCITLFLQAVMLPVCLKLGQNFVVAVFMLLVFLPISALFLLNRVDILTNAAIEGAFDFIQQNAAPLSLLGIAAAALLYAVSFLVSLRFYKRMEI
ncbi:MAG: ABC-2 transporter permease [Acutalibacter sp.]|jgi:ABC-type transport system involved in multi-copper enzyme maturation permease subunit